jgi:hypothetical protein
MAGAATQWTIYVSRDFQDPNIVVGETLTVPGTVSSENFD